MYDQNLELLDYAVHLGIDVADDPDLIWIAISGLETALPPNWDVCTTPYKGALVHYYHNTATQESLWEHPCDEHYRQIYILEKQRKTMGENKDIANKDSEKSEKSKSDPPNKIFTHFAADEAAITTSDEVNLDSVRDQSCPATSAEPGTDELMEYAHFLGIDPSSEPDLLWIAAAGLAAPLPPQWQLCHSPETAEPFYFHAGSSVSLWEHPCDEHARCILKVERSRRAAASADASERLNTSAHESCETGQHDLARRAHEEPRSSLPEFFRRPRKDSASASHTSQLAPKSNPAMPYGGTSSLATCVPQTPAAAGADTGGGERRRPPRTRTGSCDASLADLKPDLLAVIVAAVAAGRHKCGRGFGPLELRAVSRAMRRAVEDDLPSIRMDLTPTGAGAVTTAFLERFRPSAPGRRRTVELCCLHDWGDSGGGVLQAVAGALAHGLILQRLELAASGCAALSDVARRLSSALRALASAEGVGDRGGVGLLCLRYRGGGADLVAASGAVKSLAALVPLRLRADLSCGGRGAVDAAAWDAVVALAAAGTLEGLGLSRRFRYQPEPRV
jgi:hypothetical protein